MKTTGVLCRALISDCVGATVIRMSSPLSSVRRRMNIDAKQAVFLGEAMTVCAYLASWLKDERGMISLSLRSSGDKMIDVTCDGRGHIYGKTEGEWKGREFGSFTATRFEGRMPFMGTCALMGRGMEKDFEYYLRCSEQRLSCVSLAEKFNGEKLIVSGGVFLEALPGVDMQLFEKLKKMLPRGEKLLPYIENAEFALTELFSAEAFPPQRIVYGCHCTKKRASRAVGALGRVEAERLMEERGTIEVRCPDCGKNYVFTKKNLKEIFH